MDKRSNVAPANVALERGLFAQDPEPDFTPSPPRQPLPPGKQPFGPMPDQDPAPPRGPHHLPEDPVTPERNFLSAHGELEQQALRARVGPW